MEVHIKESKIDPFCDGWMLLFANEDHLTRNRIIALLRRALTDAGMDCTLYEGHSFRIGGATTVAVWNPGLPN